MLKNRIYKNPPRSGLSIYDPAEVGGSFWFSTKKLETALSSRLHNVSIFGLPLRTRSKFVKSLVCQALGYPIPKIFRKTQPRFPCQLLDIYVQKSNNLQIWNEEIDPNRRYALIQVSDSDLIKNVRVIDGSTLAALDTTGTLTQKYQATIKLNKNATELFSLKDTSNLSKVLCLRPPRLLKIKPTEQPNADTLLAISELFSRLKVLIGKEFKYVGSDQERNRGAELHKLVCKCIGYQEYADDGKFPDITNQLLEVKLQTSPTIDLGLVKPDSTSLLTIKTINGIKIRHCDVRYAIFYGVIKKDKIKLTNFIITTGSDFFKRFPQFKGKVLNKKLQIPLPANFFS